MTDDVSGVSLKRIRILKTGLWGIDRFFDMRNQENVAYVEKLATPGTELILKRNYERPNEPFRIDVLSPDGIYIGRVTTSKSQTVARLMDAGFEVVAIVNDSLPHNSDYDYGKTNQDDVYDIGWTEDSRFENNHSLCNLPYCIYLVEN